MWRTDYDDVSLLLKVHCGMDCWGTVMDGEMRREGRQAPDALSTCELGRAEEAQTHRHFSPRMLCLDTTGASSQLHGN